MAHTLIAFSETGSATEHELNAVPDQTHRVAGTDIYISKFNKLVGLYAYGHAILSAHVISPSLRRVTPVYIAPQVNDLGGYGQFCSRSLNWRGQSPLSLTTNEAINALARCTGPGAAMNNVVGVWLAEGALAPVHGEIWTVEANDTDIDPKQNQWVYGELTFATDLPVGRYQIVGAKGWMDNGGLFRFVFPGSIERPGGVLCHEQKLTEDREQRMGGMGVWGEFDSVNPPGVEVLQQLVADATDGVYMDLDIIKIG